MLEYIIDKRNGFVEIRVQETGNILASIPIIDFENNARILFEGIKDLKGSSVLAPDSVCDFARVIYVSKPKSPAVKALKKQFGGKNDIFIQVLDGQTSIISVMGFSIKSKFADDPTLFNASKSSQFQYRLSGCTDALMHQFNDIKGAIKKNGNYERGWSKCVSFLLNHDIKVEYDIPYKQAFSDNLFLIRESMNSILGWCIKDRLIDSYGKTKEKSINVMETTERMIKENPLQVSKPEAYYEKAIKDFLMASFTGMTASIPWDGKEQVNGGYIVVTDDGDVLCYHSNDRESFREYLYRNTHFEYVSADKFEWSRIFKDGEEYYLLLNASIRFNHKTR